VLIEDTANCSAPRPTWWRSNKDGVAALRDLVKSTLRLRPDRIVIARCAARSARLVKAWGAPSRWRRHLHAGSAIVRCTGWNS